MGDAAVKRDSSVQPVRQGGTSSVVKSVGSRRKSQQQHHNMRKGSAQGNSGIVDATLNQHMMQTTKAPITSRAGMTLRRNEDPFANEKIALTFKANTSMLSTTMPIKLDNTSDSNKVGIASQSN